MMPNIVVKFFQMMIYPLMNLIFRLSYRLNIGREIIFRTGEKYIFAANHPSRMDPFLMFYLLPFKEFVKIIPVRIVTSKKYMQNPFLYLVLNVFGAYPADERALKNSILFLDSGNSICMFIQGTREFHFNSKPKVGAIYLEREVKKSFLVPVKIDFSCDQLKKNLSVTFKQKFRHQHFPKDLQILADDLLRIIKK